jgi:hypothetical protein
MAQHWQPKAPTEVVERRWRVPLATTDGISAVSTAAVGVTVDSDDHELNEAVVVLSGGTDGAGSVTVTITTDDGLTLTETFYIAIRASTAQTVTARDVCHFALRKIVGVGGDPEAAELEDAIEQLQGLFSRFNIGPIPVDANSALNVPDDVVQPIKFYLRKLVSDTYEKALTPVEAEMADWGERYLANTVFVPANLPMSTTLAGPGGTVADLF